MPKAQEGKKAGTQRTQRAAEDIENCLTWFQPRFHKPSKAGLVTEDTEGSWRTRKQAGASVTRAILCVLCEISVSSVFRLSVVQIHLDKKRPPEGGHFLVEREGTRSW
jgi:hypothetical protein